MGRISHAKEHLSLEEVDQKIKQTKEFWKIKRWMVIRHALAAPQTAEQIGLAVGYKKQTVNNLLCAYNRFGICAVETKGKREIRPRAYLSLEEEASLLNSNLKNAQQGVLSTASFLKKALEEKLGHKIDPSTPYRMLQRHHWRKIVPRPTNPESSEEIRTDFKKSFQKK
jgi:transposase